MSLVPFTIDELKRLKGFAKSEAKREYHAWLQRQREQDRKEANRIKCLKRYYKLKNKRLCVICTKELQDTDKTLCLECKADKKRRRVMG